MAKSYTARDMRQAANAEELVGHPGVAAMLRQAADMGDAKNGPRWNLGELPETSRLINGYLVLQEENTKLRALVKEMADALDSYPCHNCKHGSERCEWCVKVHELDALVAKARGVVK